MIGYCGLDCSKCDGFLATKSGDKKKIDEVADKFSIKFQVDIRPEHVICDGCKLSGKKIVLLPEHMRDPQMRHGKEC